MEWVPCAYSRLAHVLLGAQVTWPALPTAAVVAEEEAAAMARVARGPGALAGVPHEAQLAGLQLRLLASLRPTLGGCMRVLFSS